MRQSGLAALLPALVAGLVSGCGGDTGDDGGTPPVQTPGEPRPLVCDDGGSVALTRGLEPSVQSDFVGLYSIGHPSNTTAPVLVESDGTLCEGASDPSTCEQRATAIEPDRVALYPDYWGDRYVFVYTSGDTVGIVYDGNELRSFLGTIDTPNEAAVIAWSIGRPLSCGTINADAEGYYARGTWQVSDCPFTDQELIVHVSPDGTTEQTPVGEKVITNQGCAGRRPSGLVAARPSRARDPLGRYFAHLAHLEAAAVVAFAVLERELVWHQAPLALVEAARRALGDEVRHAEVTTRLARRFGARPRPVEVGKHAPRSLLEMAVENAVEGCVRETYGALQAHYQAMVADDPEIRAAWAVIAREETDHAELSHALHRWLLSRLDPGERQRVDDALGQALSELRSELEAEPERELVSRAGVPDAAAARRLFGALEQALAQTALAAA